MSLNPGVGYVSSLLWFLRFVCVLLYGCLRLGGTVGSFRGMDICKLLGLRARFKVMPYISTTDINLNSTSLVNGSYYLIED